MQDKLTPDDASAPVSQNGGPRASRRSPARAANDASEPAREPSADPVLQRKNVADVVRDLESELRAQGARRWLRRGIVLAVIAALVVGVWAYQRVTAPAPPPRFVTEAVERRDVLQQVQSTGVVKPLTEVQVGAQVSGRVVSVLADFNSVVKKGDLLAEIDPSLFGAQVNQSGAQLQAAEASLRRAEARLATTRTTLVRSRSLQAERVASKAEVDQAEGEHDVAAADVGSAKAQIAQLRAQLSSAKTTLAYTRIYSPIDGVVINRAIEPGQTVASSFSAPVLFVIAQDLSQMQVLADIDEADVGQLREGMSADVVVDAFPGQKFAGKVTQVRYSPNTIQGVVTYSAVIDVQNLELKLRPGMTATVTIRTNQVLNVLAVRNSALRFRPLPEQGPDGKPVKTKAPKPLAHKQGRVYVARGAQGQEQAEERVVAVGITDGIWTQLVGSELKQGAEVITEQRGTEAKRGFRIF
ncbi:MAG TPA: efflux RND transporter periplasmic adaptor subunit [Polyangiaceae bacterium]|nr:efflux RND transporter periplasmic adaptor subunit [Polyangiaceae bacterium]